MQIYIAPWPAILLEIAYINSYSGGLNFNTISISALKKKAINEKLKYRKAHIIFHYVTYAVI